jgi:hypothetical protein
MKNLLSVYMLLTLATLTKAQTDMSRMERDIEVAENVLQTLVRQQLQTRTPFFPLEIEGTYQRGYGVTFRFPANYTTPLSISLGDNRIILDGNAIGGEWELTEKQPERFRIEIDKEMRPKEPKKPMRHRLNLDSLQKVFNTKLVEAAKTFLLDYHDLLTQLPPTEKIVITNRGEQPRMWVNRFTSAPQRTQLEITALKNDLNQYRSGKLTREQAEARITIISTEAIEAEPDLELFSSILNRLYRPDLSKTFFTDNNVRTERLKDFGVVYYMSVYSGYQRNGTYDMPTLKLENVDQATRDKKVKELYPKFESELKENMLEYGRTIKSLADHEQLVINARLTRCPGCGIPSFIEVSVKGSVLKAYSAGKINKETALSKVMVKKGPEQ